MGNCNIGSKLWFSGNLQTYSSKLHPEHRKIYYGVGGGALRASDSLEIYALHSLLRSNFSSVPP